MRISLTTSLSFSSCGFSFLTPLPFISQLVSIINAALHLFRAPYLHTNIRKRAKKCGYNMLRREISRKSSILLVFRSVWMSLSRKLSLSSSWSFSFQFPHSHSQRLSNSVYIRVERWCPTVLPVMQIYAIGLILVFIDFAERYIIDLKFLFSCSIDNWTWVTLSTVVNCFGEKN